MKSALLPRFIPLGRDLGFNPHVHALVTEGAIDKFKNWKEVGYIPYDYLRKSWEKVLLGIVQKKFGREPGIKKLINELYRRYPKGFYVHAKTRMRDAKEQPNILAGIWPDQLLQSIELLAMTIGR